MANPHGKISEIGLQKAVMSSLVAGFPTDLLEDLGEYWKDNPKALHAAERNMLFREEGGFLAPETASGPYPFVVDYEQLLEEAAASVKFVYTNPDLTSSHLPPRMSGRWELEGWWFNFEQDFSSPHGFAEVARAGLMNVGPYELAPFTKKYPDLVRQSPTVGLGQEWTDSHGDRRVAYVGGHGSGFAFRLGFWLGDWGRYWCVLGVRPLRQL